MKDCDRPAPTQNTVNPPTSTSKNGSAICLHRLVKISIKISKHSPTPDQPIQNSITPQTAPLPNPIYGPTISHSQPHDLILPNRSLHHRVDADEELKANCRPVHREAIRHLYATADSVLKTVSMLEKACCERIGRRNSELVKAIAKAGTGSAVARRGDHTQNPNL